MAKTTFSQPFSTKFLKSFILTKELLPLKDKELVKLDKDLSHYEQVFLNPDIEKHLISRNELLASFAISKAENSNLTIQEAQSVHNLILEDKNYQFLSNKLKLKESLTQKDHDKLEFFNIAKTFHLLNAQNFSADDLTLKYIQNLHLQLTKGMDIFKDYLPSFELYKSGNWRDNNSIRVGDYIPADYSEINEGINELIEYIKDNPTPTKIAIFHTALYALHPFNNGNKRICRILEHLLLRSIGFNTKNLYSTSFYYHKEKNRYYKYLLYSLERRNLNHFVSFIQEALSLSIVSVIKLSLESKRKDFLSSQSKEIRLILKPLIKRRELQFKHLFKRVKTKMARQTFVNYLQEAVDIGLVNKQERGRSTYYSLVLKVEEQDTIADWLDFLKPKLPYISDSVLLM